MSKVVVLPLMAVTGVMGVEVDRAGRESGGGVSSVSLLMMMGCGSNGYFSQDDQDPRGG